jgi:hypothetical protein
MSYCYQEERNGDYVFLTDDPEIVQGLFTRTQALRIIRRNRDYKKFKLLTKNFKPERQFKIIYPYKFTFKA